MADGSLIFDTKIDQSGFKQGASDLKGLATKVTAAIGVTLTAGAIAKGLVSLGKAAVTQGSAFEASMSQVAATMGTTVDQIQDLSAFAQKMGSTTAFSATQAAEALNYMALAGYDAKTSMEMLPNVLNLAAAGGMDLAAASDMVTDAQTALGLSVEQTKLMVDQMAASSTRSNTSVSQLGEALLTIGANARTVKGGTQELATVLGILADNGIKGSEAGTHLRNIMLRMTPTTKDAAEAWERLGVSAYENGNLRALPDVFMDIKNAMDQMGLSAEERTNMLNDMFKETDLAAVNALIGTQAQRWSELTGAIDNCAGAAEQMADTQLDNLRGDITLAQSALEGLSITAYSAFSGKLRSGVQSFSATISGLTDALGKGGLQGAITFITDKYPAATAAVTGLAVAYGTMKVVQGVTSLVTAFQTAQLQVNLATMEGTIATAAETGALTAKEIVVAALTGKLTIAEAAQALLNKTILANPYVAAAVALGALVAGLVLLAKRAEEADPDMRALRDDILEVKKANKDLAAAQAESAASFSKANSEIESQAIYAERAYGKLAKLSEGYGGTQAEQRIMSELCSELNSTIEGLNISFDEQTGALNVAADAMNNYITAMKNQAHAQAATERYTQLIKEQADAEYNLFQAKRNSEEAQRRYDEGIDQSTYYILRANKALKTAEEAYGSASEAVENFEEYMDTLPTVETATAEAAEELSESLENAAEAEEAVMIAGVDVTQLLSEIGMSADDAAARFANYSDAATNMFDKINTESELSAKDMAENLQHNAKAIEDYGKNLAVLAEVLPEDLYTALAGNPEQMAGVVAELASASESELQAIADAYSSAGDAAKEAWLTSMGAISVEESNPVADAAEAVAADTSLPDALTAKADEAKTAFEMAVNTAGFNEIGTQISDKVVEGASDLSTKMQNVGEQAMNGLISGLESKRQSIKNTVKSIVTDASTTVTLKLQIQSPSKLWRKYGAFTVEGFILGMKDKIGAVQKTVGQLTSSAGDNAYPTNTASIYESSRASQGITGGRTTHVTQNIYAEKQSPAEMLKEAVWQQERAALMGV